MIMSFCILWAAVHLYVYENAFDSHSVIIYITSLAIDNTIVKHTKHVSLSAPMAMFTIVDYIT